MRMTPRLLETTSSKAAKSTTSIAPAGTLSAAPELTLSNGLTLAPRPGLRGFHEGLSYAAYNEDPALRHSVQNRMTISPLYLKTSLEEGDDDSTAMTFGRVFHTLTLQPEEAHATVHVVNASNRNTNLYKDAVAGNPDKDVVLKTEFDAICRMRDTFRGKALTKDLLDGAAVEASCFWVDQATGIACKARPDILREGVAYDLKSTVSLERFKKDTYEFGYHRQAAWYLAAVEATTGMRIDDFCFIAVEKKVPFDLVVFQLSPEALELGRRQNRENLALYKACLESGVWPGRPDVMEELALPGWVK